MYLHNKITESYTNSHYVTRPGIFCLFFSFTAQMACMHLQTYLTTARRFMHKYMPPVNSNQDHLLAKRSIIFLFSQCFTKLCSLSYFYAFWYHLFMYYSPHIFPSNQQYLYSGNVAHVYKVTVLLKHQKTGAIKWNDRPFSFHTSHNQEYVQLSQGYTRARGINIGGSWR